MYRRFVNVSLEDMDAAVVEPSEEIVNPEAVVDAVVVPEVSEVLEKPIEEIREETEKPVDTSAAESVPAETPPVEGETPPADASSEAPSADAVTPIEPVAPPAEEPASGEETPTPPAAEETPAPVAEPAVETPSAEPGEPNAEPVVREGGDGEPLSDDELAIEELDAELLGLNEGSEDAEAAQAMMADLDADSAIEEQYSAVLETISVLAENAANLIENDKCTEETAQLIEETAQTALGQVGVDFEIPSMEAFGSDIVIRHKLVLESLDNYGDRIRQMLDVNIVQRVSQLKGILHTYETRIGKTRQKIKLLRDQFNKKKSNLEMKNHEGSLTAVGRFFNISDGNVMSVLPNDLKVSEYILNKYPTEIMKNFDDLIKILSSAKYSDDKEFIAFVKKISTIKPQGETFKFKDSKDVHALLGNAALIRQVGALPKTLSFGDESFPELADAAKFDAYTELNGELIKDILKATVPYLALGSLIVGVPAAVINVVAAHKVTLSTAEIGKLIDYAEAYADSCQAWVDHINKLIGTYQKLDVAMKRFSSIGSEISGITLGKRYRVWRILGQIKTVVRNQMRYADAPTWQESYRAQMGASYCYYLARRFVLTAQ